MLIGVPKEIKSNEFRVGLTPDSVRELCTSGHQVIIETHAGEGIGEDDEAYRTAGAEIVSEASEIFSRAEMVVKVKEPQQKEYKQLRADQILFTYLHLSPDPEQTEGLMQSKCIAVAYETVTSRQGTLPLLAPMSEVAGRMATQVGAYHLQKNSHGEGMLLGGVPGVAPSKVAILGGGVAGTNAAKIAIGMGADVTILDRNIERLRYLADIFGTQAHTVYSTTQSVEDYVVDADVVIGTVLIPGSNAPKLVTKTLLSKMKKGAVIVDVAIDQGGCTETSRATTHQEPTYIVDDVVHYCVANMPGGVPKTSTYALNNATLPFVLAIANKGIKQALQDDEHLRNGLNVCQGNIVYQAVAEAQNLPYIRVHDAIARL
ncbi:alanine dehydrogenase [Suttonella sp. R2A3]|uniref:alanine dehydrogenase n=1 Tax=Suttonella sp. R2A3 TaxID=2908648 RepID=UPI001F031C17|nr:alanine dehydrogenase [Suttonella sp. R2A3]UJF23845.1 alanine dehydrogenase [Suttonella sp. R2A3]